MTLSTPRIHDMADSTYTVCTLFAQIGGPGQQVMHKYTNLTHSC